jgi:hypothetical protein
MKGRKLKVENERQVSRGECPPDVLPPIFYLNVKLLWELKSSPAARLFGPVVDFFRLRRLSHEP